MTAREIKELSYALEALSRVADAANEYESVKALLRDKIDDLKMKSWPEMAVNLDDDIPF